MPILTPNESKTEDKIEPKIDTPNPSAPTTIRIRTLAKNTGLTAKQIRTLLKEAGVKDVEGSPYLNGNISVNINEAFAALKIQADEPPKPAKLSSEPPNPLAEIAAKAKETLIPPTPAPEGTGNEDDPVPQYLIDGSLPNLNQSFPMPTHPRSDYFYRGINVNPNRQNYMRQLGWRFVTRPDHIREIRPDKLYFGMRTAQGRVRYYDLELACIHRTIWQRRHDLMIKEEQERAETLPDTFAANVDESKRTLRDTRGPGMDRHIQAINMTEDEIISRKNFSDQQAQGGQPKVSRTFINRKD